MYDDNAAMIQVMTTGKNPTMRGLGTTHGVSINRLYELFQEEWNTLTKVDTKIMAGDIFTKGFEAKDKWMDACKLINVGPPEIYNMKSRTGGADLRKLLLPQFIWQDYRHRELRASAPGLMLPTILDDQPAGRKH